MAHWLNKGTGTNVTLSFFKTLERFKIVNNIVNPIEWTKWYAQVKEFAMNHGP